MKGLLIGLVFSLLLMLGANISSAESLAFKNPDDDHTDSQWVSEGKSVNLIKFTGSGDTVKNDNVSNEVSNPYMYLKLQWDTEKPFPYMQLGKNDEERENWQMLQLFLLLQIVIP